MNNLTPALSPKEGEEQTPLPVREEAFQDV